MTNKTKIDDILLEMIGPKLKEIEERFSRGEGLSNEDINTLLLKSQFNHINHLDRRLDEVTADVSSLKLDFSNLRADVRTEISGLRTDMAEMRTEMKTDMAEMRTELKIEMADLRTGMANMKTEIQSAINKNMQWSIGLIAFIVTALKVIDMIWGK